MDENWKYLNRFDLFIKFEVEYSTSWPKFSIKTLVILFSKVFIAKNVA